MTFGIKINYLKPMCIGKLFDKAQSVHEGSRIFVVDVEVKNEESLIAKSLVDHHMLKDSQP